MNEYSGIQLTEQFYEFFAPNFIGLISHIRDPREADNCNLRYSVSSYLSVIILGICQGADSLRQIVLLSQDTDFQEHIAFLCEEGGTPNSQNAFTNLTKQLDPQEFQQRYYGIVQELHQSGAFAPFRVHDMMIGALDGIELHNHLYADRQNVTACAYCLTRTHNKGTDKEREEYFHRHVVLTLVGHPGSVFYDQEPIYPSTDGEDKGSEKKAAKRVLERLHAHHLLEMFDVLVCDALYADADFITTVAGYGIMPVIRIKQENYNIMKDVTNLGEHISFSREDYDYERKMRYQYRVFEHLTSWQAYKGELCIVELYEQLSNGKEQKARWVFPQSYAPTLLSAVVREIGHLRWQEEINEFKLANQHFAIKHMMHHEVNSIQIFLFLKCFVLTFFSLYVSRMEPRLQKKSIL